MAKNIQSLFSLFAGTPIPKSLLASASQQVKKDEENKDYNTFEEWLVVNKKSLVKKYIQDFNEKERKKTKKTITERLKEEIHNDDIFSVLSTNQIVNLYAEFYKINDLYVYIRKILFIANILKRIRKVKDLKFNQFLIKTLQETAIKENGKSRDTELEAIKKIEVLTLKHELEKDLSLKHKVETRKVNKI